MQINELLLKHITEWTATNYKELIANRGKSIVSNPFIYGETDIEPDIPKVMIVGQEARNYREYNYQNWYDNEDGLRSEQQWTIDYLERQVYGRKTDTKFNRSPFWSFFRKIRKNGFQPMWNNLDKAHAIVDKKTISLSVEQERYLSKPLSSNGKSLLKNEIQVSKPAAVIFVTGPHYYESMAVALGCEDTQLYKKRPDQKDVIKRIDCVVDEVTTLFWTYHPNYLRRTKRMDEVVEYVCEAL